MIHIHRKIFPSCYRKMVNKLEGLKNLKKNVITHWHCRQHQTPAVLTIIPEPKANRPVQRSNPYQKQIHFLHCVKSVQIRSFFLSAFSCLQSEYRKIRTRKYSVYYLYTFHAVLKVKTSKPVGNIMCQALWEPSSICSTLYF